jgi:hypothetical protein
MCLVLTLCTSELKLNMPKFLTTNNDKENIYSGGVQQTPSVVCDNSLLTCVIGREHGNNHSLPQ